MPSDPLNRLLWSLRRVHHRYLWPIIVISVDLYVSDFHSNWAALRQCKKIREHSTNYSGACPTKLFSAIFQLRIGNSWVHPFLESKLQSWSNLLRFRFLSGPQIFKKPLKTLGFWRFFDLQPVNQKASQIIKKWSQKLPRSPSWQHLAASWAPSWLSLALLVARLGALYRSIALHLAPNIPKDSPTCS